MRRYKHYRPKTARKQRALALSFGFNDRVGSTTFIEGWDWTKLRPRTSTPMLISSKLRVAALNDS